MSRLTLFVLPLGLDTFAVAAALGARGLPARERLRLSFVMSGFEMAMPVVGLLIGRVIGSVVGGAADYVAIGVLTSLGVWMLLHKDDQGERAGWAPGQGGIAILAIGISISLDELGMGFTIGLLHMSLWLAVVLIGAQAFVLAQVGARLGARLSESLRERTEQLAAVVLIGLAVFLGVEKAT